MRPSRTKVATAAAAAAALFLGACSGSSSTSSTTSAGGGPAASSAADSAGSGLPTTVDTMFGQVEIPEPADGELTVVALGWSDAEVALALGVQPVAVYDWQAFGEANKGVGPWATALFGDVQPTILANVGDALDYEAISVLEPDLILNTRSAGEQTQYDRLATIAPTVSPPTGTAAFGTGWDVQTQLVADALGKPAEGEALVTEIQDEITSAAEANPAFTGKTAVAATKFGDGYGAYIAGDARWDLLEAMGFVQNPPVLQLPAQGFYVPVSAEQISAFDAEVAVMFPIGYTLAELQADPLISSLTVVQDRRTVFLAADDQLSQAFSAASPLSIPIAVDGIVPQLAAIAG
jgi:iron complex transport system substrate-binding protein